MKVPYLCSFVVVLLALAPVISGADFLVYRNGQADPQEEKLAEAIRKGSIVDVKAIAKELNLRSYSGLDIFVLDCARNPTVIRYLREAGGLKISELQVAIACGDVELAKRLLPQKIPQSGTSVAGWGCSYQSPLLLAIKRQDAKILQLLIDRGITVNENMGLSHTTKCVDTPLKMAISTENPRIVRMLVNAGALVRDARPGEPLYSAVTLPECSPLAVAICSGRSQIVTILLEAGADANLVVGKKTRVLHWAVKKGHPAIVKALVKHGADVNSVDDDGYTPLARAYYGKGDIAAILRKNGAKLLNPSEKLAKPVAADIKPVLNLDDEWPVVKPKEQEPKQK